MNKVGVLFSLYESESGERILTKSVSGDQMEAVLKEIAGIVSEHQNSILKPHRIQYGESQIVEPSKLDSMAAFLTLTSEHYHPGKETLTEEMKKCPKCKGDGYVMRHVRQGGQWSVKPEAVRCTHCSGSGKVVKQEGQPKKGKSAAKIMSDYYKSDIKENLRKILADPKKIDRLMKELELPSLEKGDTLLVGKFKNRRAEIKGFTTDDNNQPVAQTTKGDQKIFKPRVAKLMDEGYSGGVEKTYTIEASPNVIKNFERFLKHLQYCAGVGHSARVAMDIDGDGADRFKVTSPDLPALEDGDVKDHGSYECVRYSD